MSFCSCAAINYLENMLLANTLCNSVAYTFRPLNVMAVIFPLISSVVKISTTGEIPKQQDREQGSQQAQPKGGDEGRGRCEECSWHQYFWLLAAVRGVLSLPLRHTVQG